MHYAIELAVLLVSVVFAWKRTAAWHIRQGRGNLAAHIGGLGAGITAFAIVMGLIVAFDPPPGFSGKAGQTIPAAPAQPNIAEPAKKGQ